MAGAGAFKEGHQGGFVADLLRYFGPSAMMWSRSASSSRKMRSRSAGSAVYSESRYAVACRRTLAIAVCARPAGLSSDARDRDDQDAEDHDQRQPGADLDDLDVARRR